MPELDGVRGLAIAMVMALHFVYPLKEQNFVERFAARASGYGLWGVDLFFVLSGFLITGILYDAKGSEGYFKNFYMRRTLRIFPPTTACCSCSWWRSRARSRLTSIRLYSRHATPAVGSGPTSRTLRRADRLILDPVRQSLLVARDRRTFLPVLAVSDRLHDARPAMRARVVLAIFRARVAHRDGRGGRHRARAQVLTPCRLDTLCLGALFALGIRGPAGASAWAAGSRRYLPVATLAVVGLSTLHVLAPALDVVVLELRGTVLALFFAVLILNAQSDAGFSPIKRLFRLRFLGTLGKYSYGLYVFHGLIAYTFEQRGVFEKLDGLTGSHTFATFAYVALGVGLSFLVSIASYELFEVRFLALKKLFDYRARRTERVAPASRACPPVSLRVRRPAPELASRSPE